MHAEGEGDWLDGYYMTTYWEPRIGRFVAEVTFPFEAGSVGFTELEARHNLLDKIKAMQSVTLGS